MPFSPHMFPTIPEFRAVAPLLTLAIDGKGPTNRPRARRWVGLRIFFTALAVRSFDLFSFFCLSLFLTSQPSTARKPERTKQKESGARGGPRESPA